jgi:acetone carboxylase gamma subunit
MSDVIKLPPRRDDTLWAVIATAGKSRRIAEIYPNRPAALADRQWREQQVSAYCGFLSRAAQPIPHYSVAPIRRSDLPKAWRPLPALGFLHGQMI